MSPLHVCLHLSYENAPFLTNVTIVNVTVKKLDETFIDTPTSAHSIQKLRPAICVLLIEHDYLSGGACLSRTGTALDVMFSALTILTFDADARALHIAQQNVASRRKRHSFQKRSAVEESFKKG